MAGLDSRQVVDLYRGQLTFDGETVTVTRTSMPRGSVTFRVADLRAVEWKDAGRVVNGEVRFVVPGASDRAQTGSYWTRTDSDESRRYKLTFTAGQAAAVRELCDRIQAAAPAS